MHPITTVEEYEDATKRVAELAGYIEDGTEEAELQALIAAVEKRDFDHQPAPPPASGRMAQKHASAKREVGDNILTQGRADGPKD